MANILIDEVDNYFNKCIWNLLPGILNLIYITIVNWCSCLTFKEGESLTVHIVLSVKCDS